MEVEIIEESLNTFKSAFKEFFKDADYEIICKEVECEKSTIYKYLSDFEPNSGATKRTAEAIMNVGKRLLSEKMFKISKILNVDIEIKL